MFYEQPAYEPINFWSNEHDSNTSLLKKEWPTPIQYNLKVNLLFIYTKIYTRRRPRLLHWLWRVVGCTFRRVTHSVPSHRWFWKVERLDISVVSDRPWYLKPDSILCCQGCGCYGIASEFFNETACSETCNVQIVQKNRERIKKERELQIQKQRREQRKKEVPKFQLKPTFLCSAYII